MLFHNLFLAIKSLRRSVVLSILTVSAIALGTALSTTFAAVRHTFTRDPIPEKSKVLYYVRLDSWDPAKPYPSNPPGAPPTQVTYKDMRAIMESKIPVRQTAMFTTRLYVFPDTKTDRPTNEDIRLCFRDFFTMFQVPFR